MTPGSASEWAERASASEVRARIGELDRRALTRSPEYLREIERIAGDTVDELRRLRTAELARLREVDPGAAAELSRSCWRMATLILSVLASAGAFAFYFSRADFGIADVLPWAAGLLAVSALALAGAVLPLRRSTPPTSGIVAISWLTAVLGAATIAVPVAAYGNDPDLVPWYAAGGVAVVLSSTLAIGTMVARGGLDATARAAQDARLAAFRGNLGTAATSVVERAGTRVDDAFGRLRESERAGLRAELASAYVVLARRGLLSEHAEPPTPGLLLVGRRAVAGAASIGAVGVPPLVDVLSD